MPDAEVRDAATILLIRDAATRPAVLIGHRGAGAVFLPNRPVFPGGATEPLDAAVPLADAGALPAPLRPHAATAIRELAEETGLLLGRPGAFAAPTGWEAFADAGLVPSAAGLVPILRAITPPGRPRRFDARIFMADAARVHGGAHAPLAGDGELARLAWVPLDAAAALPIPFVTSLALAEARARLPDFDAPARIPLWDGAARTVRLT